MLISAAIFREYPTLAEEILFFRLKTCALTLTITSIYLNLMEWFLDHQKDHGKTLSSREKKLC